MQLRSLNLTQKRSVMSPSNNRDVSPWPGLRTINAGLGLRTYGLGLGLVITALALTLNQLNPANQ